MGRPATDKKDRLVTAAMRRFHRSGVAGSSIASVANDAGVPPGNVFYYFRSKEVLTEAVIERWCTWVGESLEELETGACPLDRLRNFLWSVTQRRQGYADFGCPLAALGHDLRNAPPPVAASSGRPLEILRAWLTAQFLLVLNADAAKSHADFCLASLQGSFALAHSTGDPHIVSRTVDHLTAWIETVCPDQD